MSLAVTHYLHFSQFANVNMGASCQLYLFTDKVIFEWCHRFQQQGLGYVLVVRQKWLWNVSHHFIKLREEGAFWFLMQLSR